MDQFEDIFEQIFKTAKAEVDAKKHTHRCLDCACEWSHKGKDAGDSPESLRRAHTCPECGAPQYWIHRFEGESKTPAQLDRDFMKRNKEKPYGCPNPWAGKYNYRGMQQLKEAA